jgi:hypothetical protein
MNFAQVSTVQPEEGELFSLKSIIHFKNIFILVTIVKISYKMERVFLKM